MKPPLTNLWCDLFAAAGLLARLAFVVKRLELRDPHGPLREAGDDFEPAAHRLDVAAQRSNRSRHPSSGPNLRVSCIGLASFA